MLTRTAEYALRAAAYLAAHPGESTAEAIAVATGVPPRYLAKVLGALCRAGVARSRRGPGGGFTLARRADSITLSEIVGAGGENLEREREEHLLATDPALEPEVRAVSQWLEWLEGYSVTTLKTTTLRGLCERVG
jgi:Rrf2 family protein